MKKSVNSNNRKFGFTRLIGLAAIVLIAAVFISALPTVKAQDESNGSLFGLADLFNWQTESIVPKASDDTNSPTVVGTCESLAGGVIEVEGTGGSGTQPTGYATLGAAFTAINTGVHTGAITIDVCGSTTEAAAASILNASGTGTTPNISSYTSIVMSPAGSAARTITAATTAGLPMIDFNGADNVTINGLNAGGNSLTISNTTASATSGTATIRFIGGATGNTITNSSIFGSGSMAVGTNGGNIFFSTDAVATTGNDNNTISNNNIGPAGANLNTKGIYCNGSTTTQAVGNSGISFDNNNIFDYFGAAVTSSGIYVAAGCNTDSITNNRFYQTATRTWTTGAEHNAINIQNSTAISGAQAFTITGNIIGYASNTQTGTYALSGSTGTFRGIRFNGITTGTVSNINSNTIANVSLTGVTSSGTTSSSPFAPILITNGLANTNSNTIGSQTATGSLNFSYTSTTTTDVYGLFNFSSDSWTSNGNNIGGISVTNLAASGTTTFYVTRANTLSTVTWTANSNLIGGTVGNSISLSSLGTSSQVIGMGATTAPSSFTGNTIRNLTTNTGTGTSTSASVIGISATTSTPLHTLSQNTIFNLTNTNATAASVVTGIQFTGAGTTAIPNIVERNFIYGLTVATTSATAEVNGIRVAGGITTYRNNIIDIGAGITNAIGAAASNGGTTGINGFNEALGTNNVFHNSIYIGGAPTAGTGASYAFNGNQTTNTRSFRDNIFVNGRSNSGATGKNYAVKINGTTANPTGLTINNNIYLANGSNGVFGFFNSLDVANLAAWKTVVGQDANSFEADSKYIDPTGATPNLHIQTGTPTAVEGTGADVGVVNDFDNEVRANLTPVDIGADAGNFTSAGDVSAPGIAYTALANTSSTADRALSVTVTDNVGVTAVQIYYRKNGGTYVSNSCTITGGTATSGTYNCVISAVALGGVTAADVIQYFVVAQDAAGNIGSNPSGALGTGVTNITTFPASPNSYTITGTITGNKTVGAGGDYATLTLAVAALNGSEVSGPVTLTLTDASYSTGETFPLTINANNGSSATNTVTIKPAVGVTTAISGSSASCIIGFSGADYMTIDGSNTAVGGTTRDLTITNTNAGTASAVVCIQNTAALDGATNNVVKNTNIVGNTNLTTLFGVFSGGTAISATSIGTGNNTNTIQNNNLSKTQFGIYSQGASAAAKNTGNVITQNLMNTVSPNNVAKGGIQVGFENNVTISENNIAGINTIADDWGITLGLTSWTATTFTGNEVTNATVTRNNIGVVVNTGTNSAAGIAVASAASGTNLIANNFISGVTSNSTPGDIAAGIFLGGGTGSTTNVYFNSVSMTGDRGTGTTASSLALAIGGTNPIVNARNNILFNTQTTVSTGRSYAIGTAYGPTGAANFSNLTSDNNDLFTSGANAGFSVITALNAGTELTSLSAWQTATGKDAASVSGDPKFISATNLHIDTAMTTPVSNAGTPISGITIDFDGDTRTATPDIGADEFTPPAGAGTLQFSAAAYTDTEGNNATVTVSRVGGTSGAISVNYATSDGTATSGICGSGGDYAAAAGTLNFADAVISQTFNVQLCNDASAESSETVTLTLSNPMGTTITGTNPATLNITDNPPGTVQFSAATYSGNEGMAATITATRTGGGSGVVTVDYATSTGTATGGASCSGSTDYINTNNTLTWANNDTASKTFTVQLCSDTATEATETVNLTLSNVTGGATLGTAAATLSIFDVASQFCNADGTITIPPTTGTPPFPSTPYPSNNVVSGLTGTVSNVRVTLNNFTHTFSDDVDILLVSPTGEKFILLSDAGGSTGATNNTEIKKAGVLSWMDEKTRFSKSHR